MPCLRWLVLGLGSGLIVSIPCEAGRPYACRLTSLPCSAPVFACTARNGCVRRYGSFLRAVTCQETSTWGLFVRITNRLFASLHAMIACANCPTTAGW